MIKKITVSKVTRGFAIVVNNYEGVEESKFNYNSVEEFEKNEIEL